MKGFVFWLKAKISPNFLTNDVLCGGLLLTRVLLQQLYLVGKKYYYSFLRTWKCRSTLRISGMVAFSVRVTKWSNFDHSILPNRKPVDLQNLAPGTHPPFITFNNEVKTDVNKIEEFLEEVLCPPKWVWKKIRMEILPSLQSFVSSAP